MAFSTNTFFSLANAQVLLLAAGHLQKLQPAELHATGRSSLYLNAVSNRLAASSTRARFLGMVVGMAISNLVEPTGKAMKFDLEEFETEEVDWYLGLTSVIDKIGSVQDLGSLTLENRKLRGPGKPLKPQVEQIKRTPPRAAIRKESSKIVAIEEVSDDDIDMSEDEFIPYAKPDSDASDSEDDPTLVQRNKPTAPV